MRVLCLEALVTQYTVLDADRGIHVGDLVQGLRRRAIVGSGTVVLQFEPTVVVEGN